MPTRRLRALAEDDTGDPATASAVDRDIGRLSADYLLRAIAELAKVFEGDILLGVIFLTLARVSVEYQGPDLRNPQADAEGVVSDAGRRPITTLALANSLNMPRETIRRYVNRLVELGYCQRDSERRLMVTEAVMRRPEMAQMIRANRRHLERVIAPLRRANLI